MKARGIHVANIFKSGPGNPTPLRFWTGYLGNSMWSTFWMGDLVGLSVYANTFSNNTCSVFVKAEEGVQQAKGNHVGVVGTKVLG